MAVDRSLPMPDTSPIANERKSLDKSRLDADVTAKHSKHNSSMWDKLSLHKFGTWLKKEESEEPPPDNAEYDAPLPSGPERTVRPGLLGRRTSGREVVPGLPRPITFRRQNSEKRDRLCPTDADRASPRAVSASRAGGSQLKRTLSPPSVSLPSHSAPDVRVADASTTPGQLSDRIEEPKIDLPADRDAAFRGSIGLPAGQPLPLPPLSANEEISDHESPSIGFDDRLLQEELDAKWILNLSMHFRDMSDREKFFITYAEEPNRWRRVTISCDYRDLQPDSLEADLKSLHYQRDKSSRIYESIRDSLPDIQFYDTVTNLKLQTDDGRLHVHVTEDVNEIVQYPTVASVSHLPGPRFLESSVNFESHISGFVYKITAGGKVYIKKEIPGPDTVEEFLYEINALCSLQSAQSVIKYEGLVIDDRGEVVKGLLISYAEQGALVDLVFDYKDHPEELAWPRRERWAKQIVQGLSEIHEAGFVQGDFTLSNIVVDTNDDAKIIDINRRGCPVGWEPPELSDLIEKGHRISIYIGVKSDLFQLGMVLWALMEKQDEPERQERPLRPTGAGRDVPRYFEDMVYACLQPLPRNRPSAKELLTRFPAVSDTHARPLGVSRHSVSTHHSDKDKVYIDPETAVNLADIEDSRRRGSVGFKLDAEVAFADGATSTSYPYNSSGYSIIPGRSGSPTSASALTNPSRRQYDYSPRNRISSASLHQSDLNAMACLPEPKPLWETIDADIEEQAEPKGSLITLETVSTAKGYSSASTHALPPIRAPSAEATVTSSKSEAVDRLQTVFDPPEVIAPTIGADGINYSTRTGMIVGPTHRSAEYALSAVPFYSSRSLDSKRSSPAKSAISHDTQSTPGPLLPHEQYLPPLPPPISPNHTSPSRRTNSLEYSNTHSLESTFQSSPSRISGGSFHDRIKTIHPFADLETEVLSIPTPLSRTNTGPFGPPVHHDSGFHEPTPMAANDPAMTMNIDWERENKLQWEREKNLDLEDIPSDPKLIEEREQRRKASEAEDEVRAREILQRVFKSVSGNLGKGKGIAEEQDEEARAAGTS